jgi:multisubunit Na+/H+ antiporter MnhE subunit
MVTWRGWIFWGLFLGLYLLLVDTLQASELVAGAILGAGVTLLFQKVEALGFDHYHPRLRWLIPLWRVPGAVVWETWLLLTVVVRRGRGGKRVTGLFLIFPFSAEAPGDPDANARRAIMAFGFTVTPNSYVVKMDFERKNIILRQLAGRKLSDLDRRFLEYEQPLGTFYV